MVYVLYRHAKNLRHVSPQNRFTLIEFETTTRETGLIIFLRQILGFPSLQQLRSRVRDKISTRAAVITIGR